jgi:hypothetical protein
MRDGVELLEDVPGARPLVEKNVYYDFRLKGCASAASAGSALPRTSPAGRTEFRA